MQLLWVNSELSIINRRPGPDRHRPRFWRAALIVVVVPSSVAQQTKSPLIPLSRQNQEMDQISWKKNFMTVLKTFASQCTANISASILRKCHLLFANQGLVSNVHFQSDISDMHCVGYNVPLFATHCQSLFSSDQILLAIPSPPSQN